MRFNIRHLRYHRDFPVVRGYNVEMRRGNQANPGHVRASLSLAAYLFLSLKYSPYVKRDEFILNIHASYA